MEEDLILELVRASKRLLPNCGGEKTLHRIKDDLAKMGIQIGRDRFFDLLRAHDLLVKRKKRTVFTTDSNHAFKIYGNLVKNLQITRVFQVIVADITYIRTLEGFLYLSLLTDSHSRMILGWYLGDTLELEGCVQALNMLLKPINKDFALKYPTIHHSDRGSQYCSHAYTNLLKQFNFQISMATAGNCYENAQAERVNGILKDEFELHLNFCSKKVAKIAVKDAIKLYNTERPHRAINMQTPKHFFQHNFKQLFV